MFSTTIFPSRHARTAIAALAATAMLAIPSGAFAASPNLDVIAKTLPLTDQASGRIEAGIGDRAAYYSFAYPGAGAMVNISLEDSGIAGLPHSSETGNSMPGTARPGGWGFNVFAPDGTNVAHGFSLGSVMPSASATLASGPGGTYLIEVFSHDPAVALNYSVTETTVVSGRRELDPVDRSYEPSNLESGFSSSDSNVD